MEECKGCIHRKVCKFVGKVKDLHLAEPFEVKCRYKEISNTQYTPYYPQITPTVPYYNYDLWYYQPDCTGNMTIEIKK